ncbi:hypothetical protein EBZ80_14005 [bacterium]|nr:hypothetical protein [bacterium]
MLFLSVFLAPTVLLWFFWRRPAWRAKIKPWLLVTLVLRIVCVATFSVATVYDLSKMENSQMENPSCSVLIGASLFLIVGLVILATDSLLLAIRPATLPFRAWVIVAGSQVLSPLLVGVALFLGWRPAREVHMTRLPKI